MGLLSFIKEAGEKLFSKGNAQTAMAQAQADPASVEKVKAANDAAADAILDYIGAQNLKATGLTVTFDAATATVYGIADNQATRENANKYNAIFEANKPMLKSPDLIYPGQMLRIPPQ